MSQIGLSRQTNIFQFNDLIGSNHPYSGFYIGFFDLEKIKGGSSCLLLIGFNFILLLNEFKCIIAFDAFGPKPFHGHTNIGAPAGPFTKL